MSQNRVSSFSSGSRRAGRYRRQGGTGPLGESPANVAAFLANRATRRMAWVGTSAADPDRFGGGRHAKKCAFVNNDECPSFLVPSLVRLEKIRFGVFFRFCG